MVVVTSDYEKYLLERCFRVEPKKIVLVPDFNNNIRNVKVFFVNSIQNMKKKK